MCLMVEIVCQEYDVVLTTFVATHYQAMIPMALYYDLPSGLIGLLAFKDYTGLIDLLCMLPMQFSSP